MHSDITAGLESQQQFVRFWKAASLEEYALKYMLSRYFFIHLFISYTNAKSIPQSHY